MRFYSVIRIFYKGDKETHSIQIFDDYTEAQKRFYSIIAADLQDSAITYNACYVIDAQGLTLDCKVFDRTEV